MTITAKYPGTCAVCGRPINVGQQIEWVKGKPAVHADCSGKAASPRARRPTRPAASALRGASPALRPGEQHVSRPSRGYGDGGYKQGATLCFHRMVGGGGPDGHYWTVLARGKHRVAEAENDTREGEWDCWAHIRPATDAEAAPVAERIAQAEVRKAAGETLIATLQAAQGEVVDGRPADCTKLWADYRMAGSESWHQAPDGTIYYTRSDYDMGPTTWRTTATAEQIERAKTLGLRPGLI